MNRENMKQYGSKLLNPDGDFYVLSKELCAMIGVNETIFLREMKTWCMKNAEDAKKSKTHVHDNRWWMYMTIEDWADTLLVSTATIKRIVSRLSDYGIVDVEQFNGFDRINWYSPNEKYLNLMYLIWSENGKPKVNQKNDHKSFSDQYIEIVNEIKNEKDKEKREEKIKKIMENIAPSDQNDPMSNNAVFEPPSDQNDPIEGIKMIHPRHKNTQETNKKDSGEKISEKISDEIDPYLQDDLLPETVSPDDGDSERLIEWVAQKNGASKKTVRGKAEALREEHNYDGTMISAMNLYERDKTYRGWCDLQYDELHGKFKDKSIPLGVDKTIELVTQHIKFHQYNLQGHAKYDIEDEMDPEYVIDSELWEE